MNRALIFCVAAFWFALEICSARAVQRISEFTPWKIEGPVEMKIESYPGKPGISVLAQSGESTPAPWSTGAAVCPKRTSDGWASERIQISISFGSQVGRS